MFLTENLPPKEAKPELTIIETAQENKAGPSMINTGPSRPNVVHGNSGH